MMRNKLIELIREGNNGYDFNSLERIADYLLANGVIVPPCKVGDKVFFVGHISDAIPDFIYTDTITKIGVTTSGLMHERGIDFNDIGKTVFLTREEAERALRKEDGKND